MAVIAGLNVSAISRLKFTWQKVDKLSMDVFFL